MRSFVEMMDQVKKLGGILADENYFFAKLLGATVLSGTAILLVMGLLIYGAFDQHRKNQGDRAHLEVLSRLNKLDVGISSLKKAEADFFHTGNDVFLGLFKHEQDEVHATIGLLSAIISSSQKETIKEISTDLNLWLQEEAIPRISAKKTGKEFILSGKGENNLTPLYAAIKKLVQAEESVMANEKSHCTIQEIVKTGSACLLCLLAIIVLIGSSRYSFQAYRKRHGKIAKFEKDNRTVTEETQAIIETSLDGILIIDTQGLVQSINDSGLKMFGFSSKELLGKSISKIIPQRLFLHDMASLGRGIIMAMGHRHDLSTFPVEISLNKICIHAKTQYVASIRDISDRKRSEDTLKHIGISVSSHTGGEFLRTLVKQLCKALETEFAFIVETISIGDSVRNTVVISSKDEIRSETDYDLNGTAFQEARKGFRAYPSEVCKEFPNDQILHDLEAHSFVAMSLLDHTGHSVGVMGVIDRKSIKNIPMAESTLQIFSARAASEIERKRFEEDLAAEKERLAVTLRSIGDGFIATDEEGRVMLLNSVTERFTGWSQVSALGKPLAAVFNIIHEKTRTSATDQLREIVKTTTLGSLQNRALLISQTGEERLIETSVAPIRDKTARTIGVVLAFRDITEKERLEVEHRKTEKLESLGVVAGGIAHDFNNLLTSILGNLSLSLMESSLTPTIVTYLTTAKKASLRAQDLSQQLLTFAKGGAPVKKIASVGQLIEETVNFSLRSGKIRSIISVPGDLWPVEIDPGQISQVISNLTINAEQSMPSGGGLQVNCCNVKDPLPAPLPPGKFIRIDIQDEGCGIPEASLKKIFDPYFTTKTKGSGLGLASAHSIIIKHGGAILVKSKVNHGTTFSVYIPASDKGVIADTASNDELVRGQGRILILDDEPEICTLVSNALTPLGYEVATAFEGGEAIQLYQEALIEGRCFDAVISDLTIPGGMGGQEALQHLLEIDPQVKAIVSSGYANASILSNYKEYGFLACLTKPYEIADLSRMVSEVINGHKTND